MLLWLWLFLFSFSSPLHVFCHRASGFCFSPTFPAPVPFLLSARYKKGVKGKSAKKFYSFLVKKIFCSKFVNPLFTPNFFRPLTPFLYRATLIRAQAAAAKFSGLQKRRRRRSRRRPSTQRRREVVATTARSVGRSRPKGARSAAL